MAAQYGRCLRPGLGGPEGPEPHSRLGATRAIPIAGEPTASFAEIVPLFQELFEPDPSRVVALMGRIKNLHAAGLPTRRPGRGKAAHYNKVELLDLLFAMELTHIGLPPAKAVEVTLAHRDRLFGTMELRISVRGDTFIQVDLKPLRDAVRKRLPQMFFDT